MLNRTIGITGCSGMLGRHLLNFFLKKNYSVVGTSRTKVNIKNKRFKWKKIDLSLVKNELEYKNLFKNVCAIVHAGSAVPSKNIKITKSDYLKTNIRASKKLINFTKKNNIHLIYISGAIIYGNTKKKVKENFKIDNKKMILNYENSKKIIDLYLAEKIKKEKGKFTILRPSSIYGKGYKNDKIIIQLINKIKKKNKIILNSPFQKINFIHANDVANATYLSIIKKKYSIFNIGSNKLYSIKDIAKISNNLGIKKSLIKVNKNQEKLIFKKKFNISISHAKNVLGWKPKILINHGIKLIFKNRYS